MIKGFLTVLALSGCLLAAGPSAVTGVVLEPGAQAESLQLHFAGSDRVTTNLKGGLDIMKSDGTVWHYSPRVYQVVNGKQRNVVVGFHVIDKDHVALRMWKADPSAPVILAR